MTVTSPADKCSNETVTPSAAVTPPPASLVAEQPQPVVPTPAGKRRSTPSACLPRRGEGPVGAVAERGRPSTVSPRAESSGPPPARQTIADTATAATLPFTGIPVWIAVLIGGFLLATGLVLRRAA